MKSWVRYAVAVYFGLLLAGSLITSRQAAAGPSSLVPPARGLPRCVEACPTPQPAPEAP